MRLYHVVAMARHRVIGKGNRLPWHFSADLRHFSKLTKGSTVLMGRKTYESIGRPLPDRENFVLSRTRNAAGDHLRFFRSLDEALANVPTEKCFVIGGAQVYRETLDSVEGIFLTEINQEFPGDVFYPEIPSSFREKQRTPLQENPKLEVIFYERIQ